MPIQVRKAPKGVEQVKRPKEQQDSLAGGELPSPDFVPAPTQQESMDMFRKQRTQDIQEQGGRSPQSETPMGALRASILTQRGQSEAVIRAHVKTMRDLGYDDETIKANMPGKLIDKLNKMEIEAIDPADRIDIRNERQKLFDQFLAPPSSISPEDRAEGRRPASEKQSTQGRMRQAEFDAGKPRLDSIYYPSGHPKAGELTPHGNQLYGEIQGATLDLTGMGEVRKNQDAQREKYKKYGLDVLKKQTE